MILRRPLKNEFVIYKKLEIKFYKHHKPYDTLLQDVAPSKRNLEKEFLSLLKDRNSFFRFAELNNEVVGYICGFIKKVEANEKGWRRIGDLNSIIILKEFRRKGIAEYMVREFFKWLKSKNIRYVEASSNIKNDPIIKFNKKIGFKEQQIKFGKIIK